MGVGTVDEDGFRRKAGFFADLLQTILIHGRHHAAQVTGKGHHGLFAVFERHGISVDFVPNGIDNVSLVVPTAALAPHLYSLLAEIQQDVKPDRLEVLDQIAIVAAVGHRMAFRPGVSGQIFAALGEAGINIRMINQGPDELNIIFGVDNKDFADAIRVLYNSFVK